MTENKQVRIKLSLLLLLGLNVILAGSSVNAGFNLIPITGHLNDELVSISRQEYGKLLKIAVFYLTELILHIKILHSRSKGGTDLWQACQT